MWAGPEPLDFGGLLKHYRLGAELTQEGLAERAELAVRSIPGLEAGAHKPQRETLRRLIEALSLTPEQRKRLEVASRRLPESDPSRCDTSVQAARRPNLSVQLTSFVGREQELEEIARLLEPSHDLATLQARLVTLIGTGGCGKTRLALEAASRVQASHPDGVWFVDLAPVADPILVPQTVMAALKTRQPFFIPPLDALIDYLRPRRGLLVLDNCEHLLDACADLGHMLLRNCPELRILATSRRVLRVDGEYSRRVPSLAVPDPDNLPAVTTLAEYEAVRLFIERARAVRSAFTLTDANAAAVAQVCHKLDGIPLAIELAAARLRALSVEQLANRINNRLLLLTGGNRTSPPRQQTLRATLDWSYDLLSRQERCLFERLSVFAGGWTIDAAEAICAGDGLDQSEVLDVLTRLVDQSLVLFAEVDVTSDGGRYRLLETLRQYALERLTARPRSEELQRAHSAYFCGLAEAFKPGVVQLASLEKLASDLNNFRVALRWHFARGAREDGLRQAAALGELWSHVGRPDEGYTWLQDFLALRRGATTRRTRAKARCWAGALALMVGDAIAGRGLLLQSLAYARAAHDDAILGEAALRLGLLNNSEGDYMTARTLFQESLAARRRCHAPEQVVKSIHFLALAMIYQSDYAAAEQLLDTGRTSAELIGCRNWTAAILGALGLVAVARGDNRTARTLYRDSLRLFDESMDWPEASAVQNYLAALEVREGNFAAARAGYAASLALSRPARFLFRLTQSLDGLAILAVEQAAPERAFRTAAASARLRQTAGYQAPPFEAEKLRRALARARQTLGKGAADAAWTAGQALSLDAAINEALQQSHGV